MRNPPNLLSYHPTSTRMRPSTSFGGFLLGTVLLAGCRDAVTPAPAARELSTSSSSAAPAAEAHWPARHACFVTTASPTRPGWWRYRRVALHFRPEDRASDGASLTYRFRRRAADGTPVRVANCTLPRTQRAITAVSRWLGVSPHSRDVDDGSEGDAILLGDDCSWTAEGACMFNPIIAIGEPSAPVDPTLVNPGGSTYTPPSYNGGDGGSGGTDPETDSPCLDCTAESATMSCTGVVVRGATVTCTVSAGSGLASSMVRRWSWRAAANAPVAAEVSGPERVLSWSGPAVTGGTVEVVVLEEGQARTLSAAFAVTERGWTWASRGVSEYRDGTGHVCYDGPPTLGQPNGINHGLGWSNCQDGQRQIQPDSYETGDGFTVATASGGPNQGLHYVSGARLYLRRESAYNPGMQPYAAPVTLYDTQLYPQRTRCGASANWYQFSRCMGTDPEPYLAAVRVHEGYGSTGHNGHFSAAYDAVSAPGNDPLVFFDKQVASNTTASSEFAFRIREQFRGRAQQAEDDARHLWEGGKVGNNWTGTVWVWLPLEKRFTTSTHTN